MTYEEAIKEAEIQIDVYESMILYNKDFEPKNDNSNYERKIEFLKMAIKALRKQQPKEPTYGGDGYDSDGNFIWDEWLCPKCGSRYDVDYDEYNYCPNCGQAIDWNDIDEYERYK